MNSSYNNNTEDQENSVEDKAFDLTVRKMKTKVYPQQMPKHVSEMSRFTDYGDNKIQPSIISSSDSWKFKI